MELIASGRASSVYAVDDRTVLRRTSFDTTAEARLMHHLRHHGYPVPEVYRAEGGEMFMERLHGPTLLTELATGRIAPEEAATILLDLLNALHRMDAPEWLPTTSRGLDLAGPEPESSGAAGRAILHLDLHPDNVLLTEAGPTVIDWTNAAAGDPAIDRAVSWTILAEVDPSELDARLASGLDRMLDLIGAGLTRDHFATALRFREADLGLTLAELDRARARSAAAIRKIET